MKPANRQGRGARRAAWAMLIGALCAAPAPAGFRTFFGEDFVGGDPIAPRPNADAAAAAFFSQLTGVGTESFEAFAAGTPPPFVVNFGVDTATLTGSNTTVEAASPTGQFATDGNRFLLVRDTGEITISFSSPQGVFGFYANDVGDFGGQLVVALNDPAGTTLPVPSGATVPADSGAVLFFGIIGETVADTFTTIQFDNVSGMADFFGYDEMTIGQIQQVASIGPGPEFADMINRQADVARMLGDLHLSNFGTRLEDRRAGRTHAVMLADAHSAWRSAPASPLLARVDGPAEPIATDAAPAIDAPFDAPAQPTWSIYGAARMVFGEQDFDISDEPYHVVTGTVGIDAQVADGLVVGAAMGYAGAEADLPLGGRIETDAMTAALYGTWLPAENVYVDLVAAYNYLDFDQERRLVAGGPIASARSEPHGHQFTGSLRAGFDVRAGAWWFGPFVRADYTHTVIDGYTETGAGPFDLSVERQRVDSLRTRIGGQVSHRIEAQRATVVPQVRAAWVREHLDEARTINAQFVSIPGVDFGVPTDAGDRDYAELGAGVAVEFDGGAMLYAEYEVELGNSDRDSHLVSVGVRFTF